MPQVVEEEISNGPTLQFAKESAAYDGFMPQHAMGGGFDTPLSWKQPQSNANALASDLGNLSLAQ